MVGTHAGDMISEIALAIEMGADAVDIDMSSCANTVWVYRYVPYATPVNALHHAHVCSTVHTQSHVRTTLWARIFLHHARRAFVHFRGKTI